MEQGARFRPVVILGPTAGGKSELAVGLAQALGGEVIGADSMQVYRHMEAGTAKPSARLRGLVRHHLIDIVEPTERFTVADWLKRAEGLIAELEACGVRPIVVGGTNLYIRALLEGMFEAPSHDPAFREQLAPLPNPALHRRLQALDPQAASRIHVNDRKKMVRALEVHHLTGKPISQQQTQWDQAESEEMEAARYRHDPILVGLDWPVEAINRRINHRVKGMFFPDKAVLEEDAGGEGLPESLVDEVIRLKKMGLLGSQASQALGYKQVLDHLDGKCSMEDAYEKTKVLTRRFAKMQRTWLRRFRGVKWIPAAGREGQDILRESVDCVSGCI